MAKKPKIHERIQTEAGFGMQEDEAQTDDFSQPEQQEYRCKCLENQLKELKEKSEKDIVYVRRVSDMQKRSLEKKITELEKEVQKKESQLSSNQIETRELLVNESPAD
jgi:hypothetical protein